MRFEKEYYEDNSLWDREPEEYQIEIIEEIKRIIPEDVSTILDAGCGNGIISNELLDRYDITAIDISESALRYVRAEKKLIASLENLPFGDGAFDLVMVNDVLEHLSEDLFTKAISELKRVARKYIIVTSPFLENPAFNYTRCPRCGYVFHVNLHKRGFDFEDICNLFDLFGLEKVVFCGRAYQSTQSAFINLRHKEGKYIEGVKALCPECGERFETKSDARGTSVARFIDIEEFLFLNDHRDLWIRRPDRQEFIALYKKGYVRDKNVEVVDKLQTIDRINSGEILFSPLLRQKELKPFYPFSQYQILANNYEYSDDMLRVSSDSLSDCLKFSFPHIIKGGERLEIEIVSQNGGRLIVSLYDSLIDRFIELENARIAGGGSRIGIDIQNSIPPSRFGTLFLITLSGDASLKKISLKGIDDALLADVIRTDGHLRRVYKGVELLLRTEEKEIYPFWFYEDLNKYSKGRLFAEVSEKEMEKIVEEIKDIIFASIERVSAIVKRLENNIEEIEDKRRVCEEVYKRSLGESSKLQELLNKKEEERARAEEMYQGALKEIKVLKERLEAKELEREEAERIAKGYFEDLKRVEGEYVRLNERLNEVEALRDRAERAYSESLEEIKRLQRLLEQKDERLNHIEDLRSKAEDSYSNLLKEYNLLKEDNQKVLYKLNEVEENNRGLLMEIEDLKKEIKRVVEQKEKVERERDEYKNSFEIIKGRRVRRVLVLSHMFPHPDQMVFGPFVRDQVNALLRYTDLDVRVISCRPFWMNTYNPLKLKEANRVYWEEVKKVRWEEMDGIKVMYPPYRVGGPFRFITHWHTYSQAVMSVIYDVLRDFRFDIVHAHTAYIDGSAAKLIYERFRIPYIITEHMAPYSEYVRNPIVLNKSIEASRYALRILCVSHRFRDEIASFMPEDVRKKLFVFGNGVYTDLFYPMSDRSRLNRPVRLSFVGTLEERKNPILMLRVFKRLRDSGRGVILNIIGSGPLLDKVRGFIEYNNIKDYVSVSNFLPLSDYARFLRENTDILVHPSRSESFGVVIIEALSSGKPVVATRCGGPEFIIDSDRLGRLVDADDGDELYEAIVDVIENYERFDPVWMHNYIKERFGFENIAKRLREIYEEVTRAL